jgi:hypothetical protein
LIHRIGPRLSKVAFLATTAWIKSKPSRELLEESATVKKNSFAGNVELLITDKSGLATSGVIEISGGLRETNPTTKVWFDRSQGSIL